MIIIRLLRQFFFWREHLLKTRGKNNVVVWAHNSHVGDARAQETRGLLHSRCVCIDTQAWYSSTPTCYSMANRLKSGCDRMKLLRKNNKYYFVPLREVKRRRFASWTAEIYKALVAGGQLRNKNWWFAELSTLQTVGSNFDLYLQTAIKELHVSSAQIQN